MSSMKRNCQLALSAIVVSSMAASVEAQALPTRSGSAGWAARSAAETHCVSDRQGGRELCWQSSPGSVLTDIVETADGWVAAGHTNHRGRRELFVLSGNGQSIEQLPTPPAAKLPRGRPQLIADGDRLLGLVWLEGARQEELTVQAAEWLTGLWGSTTTLSPRSVGSQLAPSATVLADGRWLVVWTAYDGRDDETLWSAWDGEQWSAPARLHEENTTPDVTPTVLAVGSGALAAWSWLDGSDYRLRLAAFDGTGWHLLPPGRERGVVSPRLSASTGDALVTFSSVVPEAWTAIELDSQGNELRRAIVASGSTSDPLVEPAASGVAFDWSPAGSTLLGAWQDPP